MSNIRGYFVFFILSLSSSVQAGNESWGYFTFADDFTDEISHVAAVVAQETPESSLSFVCRRAEVSAAISVDALLSDRAHVVVRYRVDTDEAQRFSVEHPMLVDGKRLINIPVERVAELIEAVESGRDSIVIALYSSGGSGQARFPLDGATKAVGEVLANCGIE